jgi:hypothetical protein
MPAVLAFTPPMPLRRQLHLLICFVIFLAASGCESFMGSAPDIARPSPKRFVLVGAGTTEEELIRTNGVPSRREQRGATEVWTYLIDLPHGVTTGTVQLQGDIVTHCEATFTLGTDLPPPPVPVRPREL